MPFAQPAIVMTPPPIWGAGMPLSPEEMTCVRAVRRLGNLRSEAKDELARIQLLCVCRDADDMRRLVRYSMKQAWHEDQQARIADPHHTPGSIARKTRDGWQSTVRQYARDHGLECKAEVRAIDNNRRGDYDLVFSPKDDPFLKWVAAGGRHGADEAELIALCRKNGKNGKNDATPEAPGNVQEDVAPENAAPMANGLAVEESVAEEVAVEEVVAEALVSEDAVMVAQEVTWQAPSSQDETAELPQDAAEPASVMPESPTDEISMQPAMVAEAAMQDAADASGQGEHDLPAQAPVRPAAGNAAAAKPRPVKSRRTVEPAARTGAEAAGRGAVSAPPSRPRWYPKQRHIVLDVPPGMTTFAAPGIAQLPPGYWDRHGPPAPD